MLQNGSFACPKCSTLLDSKGKMLGSHPCPNCRTFFFFPCEMKDYILYAPLGIGGLGRVFLAAKHYNYGTKYAVKLSNHTFNGDKYALKTLIKEGETGLRLGRHPNIVEVIAVESFDDVVFIVYPLIEGMRLDRIISFAGCSLKEKLFT